MLALCSYINKDLYEGVRDPVQILDKLKAVYEAQKMLEAEDKHRDQAILNLLSTLNYADVIFREIGIYEDFILIVTAIQNYRDPANNI